MNDTNEKSRFSEPAARTGHCWFDVDRVPGDPDTTDWKRRARFQQAQWRATRGYAIGSQPYGGGDDATPIGSRLDLAFARSSGANFLTAAVREAVNARLAQPEQHQTIQPERLWADLLSSMPLCFNLFGELKGEAAARFLRSWCPEVPAGAAAVRFEHSPGRRNPEFLGNQSAFDCAFDIELAGGERAIIGVETKYHEHTKTEPRPKDAALRRYVEVTERSGAFADGWRDRILGTELQQIWLDHLLVLSMLQHSSAQWTSGKFVLVYPGANPSFARAAEQYAALLRDPTTFAAKTIESTVDCLREVAPHAAEAFVERYAVS